MNLRINYLWGLLFFLILNVTVSSQKKELILLDNPNSGFEYEFWESQTYLEPNMYIGTSPNGHVLKIRLNETGQRSILDLGRPKSEDNISTIRGLTNDGHFIYGATSFNTSLFYIDTSTDAIFVLNNATNTLRDNKVTFLMNPVIYSHSSGKSIFFALITWDNKYKFLEWKINGNNPTVNDIVVIHSVPEPGMAENFIQSMAISRNTNNNPTLIMGTNEKLLFIYNLSQAIESQNPLIFSPGFSTNKIVANSEYPGVIWLFSKVQYTNPDIILDKAINYNYEDFSSSIYDDIIPLGDDKYSTFLFKDNKIYTPENVLDVQYETVTPYSNSGKLEGRNLMCDEVSKRVFSVSRWSSGDPKLQYVSIDDPILGYGEDVNFKDAPENFSPPYGKAPIVGLTVYDNIVYGSQPGFDLVTYDIWGVRGNDIKIPSDCYQADGLIAHNNYLFGGFYNKPYFCVFDNSGNLVSQYNIQSITLDTGQIRIVALAAKDNFVFFGTMARENNGSSSTYAALFAYNISEGVLKHLANVNSGHITSLAVANSPTMPNRYLIYGTTGDGIFVYNFKNDLEKSGVSIPLIYPFKDNYNGYSVVVDGNKLFVLLGWSRPDGQAQGVIYKYNSLPLSNTNFANPTESLIIFPWHIDGGQIVKGNDNFLYVSYVCNDVTQFGVFSNYLDQVNISNNPMTVSRILTNNSQVQGRLIQEIAVDRFNTNNKDLYIGFQRGDLARLGYLARKQVDLEQHFVLSNYPNPFNPSTTINYSIPEKGIVEVKIFNLLGQQVAELVNDLKEQGNYSVVFNGSKLASGIYFCRLMHNNKSFVSKIILSK